MDSPNGTFHQIISPGSLLICSAIFLFDEESIVYWSPMHFSETFLLSEKSSKFIPLHIRCLVVLRTFLCPKINNKQGLKQIRTLLLPDKRKLESITSSQDGPG